MGDLKYDCFTCEEKAKKLGISLEQILEELDEYAVEFVLYWLANRHKVDIMPQIVEGTYTSVWEGEGEITAKAKVNLNTRKVEILESFDPADFYDEDGNPFECEFLEDEYVTIDGIDYPCHRYIEDKYEQEEWNNWSPKTGFYYE